MKPVWENTRVIKKFSANQAGALKLSRRHGDALVCVRYRQSEDGTTRYTTIELLVDEARIIKRQPETKMVNVRLRPPQPALRKSIEDNGGEWDAKASAWRLSRDVAQRLGLMKYVIAE